MYEKIMELSEEIMSEALEKNKDNSAISEIVGEYFKAKDDMLEDYASTPISERSEVDLYKNISLKSVESNAKLIKEIYNSGLNPAEDSPELEYKTLTLETKKSSVLDKISPNTDTDKELNQYTKEGWKVHSITPLQALTYSEHNEGNTITSMIMYTLEREVNEK